jgi:hypothetical protein
MESKEYRTRTADRLFAVSIFASTSILFALLFSFLTVTDWNWFSDDVANAFAICVLLSLACGLGGSIVDAALFIRKICARIKCNPYDLEYRVWGHHRRYSYSEILCGVFRGAQDDVRCVTLGNDLYLSTDDLLLIENLKEFEAHLLSRTDIVVVDFKSDIILAAARRSGWTFRRTLKFMDLGFCLATFAALGAGEILEIPPLSTIALASFGGLFAKAYGFDMRRFTLTSTGITARSSFRTRRVSFADIQSITCVRRAIDEPFKFTISNGKTKLKMSAEREDLTALYIALARVLVERNGHAHRYVMHKSYLTWLSIAGAVFVGVLALVLLSFLQPFDLPIPVFIGVSVVLAAVSALLLRRKMPESTLILEPDRIQWIGKKLSIDAFPAEIIGAMVNERKNIVTLHWQNARDIEEDLKSSLEIHCKAFGLHWSVLLETLKRTYPNAEWNFERLHERFAKEMLARRNEGASLTT